MKISLRNSISSILFWFVISAAFIGPGTVTTAASAGAAFGIDLIWVLVLSTFACIILQINITQITITTGKTLGELLLLYFNAYKFIPITIGFSIVFGCAAYQAGNLLGAILGVGLLMGINQKLVLLFTVLLACSLLWFGSITVVVRILGSIVALMGVVFMIIAFSVDIEFKQILLSTFHPIIPVGAEILVMGLIGTTIVPYNLFLGSGLSKGKNLTSSKIGLILAISAGGLISIAILLAGTLVTAPFNFEKLSGELTMKLGIWANYLLGIGLFSAGFTSSLTAPLAAVFTIKSIYPANKRLENRNSLSYKSIWGIVMISGLVFGFLNIHPIPAIILAQAVNGIILPLITIFILVLVLWNQLEKQTIVSFLNKVLLALVVYLLLTLGIFNLLRMVTPPGIDTIYLAMVLSIIILSTVLSLTYLNNRIKKST